MDPARSPVVASKHRARGELQSRRKLLPNLREFHSTRDIDEHRALRVDTCFKERLYYGNEICRRSIRLFSRSVCFWQDRSRRTEGHRKSNNASRGVGQRLRVSKNKALLHE